MRRIVFGARAFAFSAAVCVASVASAGVVFSTGTDNTGTDNVLFDAACVGGNTGGTNGALIVTGCLNTSHTTLVDFTGNELLKTNGGQASLFAADGAFTQLLVNMRDPLVGFTKILFNIDVTNGGHNDGSIDIVATLFAGGSQASYSTTMAVAWNGENKFIVESDGGDVIQSLYFDVSDVSISSIDFADTKQVRLGVANQPCLPGYTGSPPNCIPPEIDIPVPEPGTLALFGLGLAAVGVGRRRERR